ncbi:helix-turn-helix transcriptional regulator [Amycolatopsis jiangsuensis]|uniref:Transcriptional regulator with XRE-family HTH domain n=1 Tax=Amycolatopsis jiangsuensis TaxID=1181879 RepID=A0A840J8L5_9PSEU|nr:helix-turn-helix domain-containing protein [Amycolatopsis jiangsuensis]MBB4689762.1 transcriptional regulator with XRE-family HTH domain [Amycolatopsis jiangsuensis]
MDRRELAGFLRGRRERISPADVGLPAGTRRRTPGLRREEVARLAYISTEYYTRLEQARGPRPSQEVLAGLTRALRLTDVERDHLHRLADAPLVPSTGPAREVRQSILDLLRRLPQAAAIVLSAAHEVIAWNDLAVALMEDFSALPRRERNFVRRAFLGPHLYGLSDVQQFAHSSALRLRAAAARYPGDADLAELIADLRAGSAEFARLWEQHDVRAEPVLRKTFRHPVVGPVTVDCDVLEISDRDQQVVLYTVAPGSASEEAFRLLSVIGTQRMTPEDDAPSRATR